MWQIDLEKQPPKPYTRRGPQSGPVMGPVRNTWAGHTDKMVEIGCLCGRARNSRFRPGLRNKLIRSPLQALAAACRDPALKWFATSADINYSSQILDKQLPHTCVI